NSSINGNDWAIRRKKSYSKGRSSNKDISRTHSNNPPEKISYYIIVFFQCIWI
ncbi:unnamed protein product, partial [Rotaria sp. Silwood1]